jgi:hypothetical protein
LSVVEGVELTGRPSFFPVKVSSQKWVGSNRIMSQPCRARLEKNANSRKKGRWMKFPVTNSLNFEDESDWTKGPMRLIVDEISPVG